MKIPPFPQDPISFHAMDSLQETILARISKEEQGRLFKKRLFTFGLSGVSAFLFSAGSYVILWNALVQSGFTQFFSLLFTDMQVLTQMWKEYAFALIESLPIFWLVVTFAITGIFFWIVNQIVQLIRPLKHRVTLG